MRQRALRAENGVTGGKSGTFVADSCCGPRAKRVKSLCEQGLREL
jgi:hypothetical protein